MNIQNSSIRKLVLLGAASILLATLAGCGEGASASTAPDPDRAREALRSALDSWKAGDPHDAPARRADPIRVADEDWLAGARLLDFQLGEPEPPIGPSLRCPVTLTLKGPRGKAVKRPVFYSVATGPTPMVIRQD